MQIHSTPDNKHRHMRGDFMSLIHVQNLTFAYEGSYDNIFDNVSFDLDTNWKLGFTGRNGQYAYEGIITASVKFDYFPFEVPAVRTFIQR